MTGAARATFFIASKPQRDAVVWAGPFQQSIPAHRIAECDQLLGKKLHAHWQAMVLQQLLREQGEDPVAAEDFAHWVSGSGAGQRRLPSWSPDRGTSPLALRGGGGGANQSL